jgi:hypothetical protein
MPADWVHRRSGSGSRLPQLPHGYPTNTDRGRMGVHHEVPSPLSKQSLSHWVVEAISLAYSSKGYLL